MSKSSKKEETKKEVTKEETPKRDIRHDYNPSEPTIKEMMIMKNVDRDEAIRILRNPTPHKIHN